MKKYFFIVLLFLCIKINAFKIDRVILSTDCNPNYLEFWPIVAKAWKEIIGVKPTLAFIAPQETIIDESIGDVIRFEPIEGVPTALHAQLIRLLLPVYFENEVCLISDIDMIPLSKEYFIESTKNCSRDCFIVYRDGAYREQDKKFPMCYNVAQGRIFKEIFDVSTVDNIPTIIKQWSGLELGWYTDELLLYKYVTEWKDYNQRCIRLGHSVEKRIDRSYWTYHLGQLKNKFYIDMHCPRPYSKYKREIDTIVDTVIKNNSLKKIIKKKGRVLENADYGTHMASLISAVMHTDGPVLEMGSGDYSTPLLHALCSKNKRFLLTTDTDKKWLENFIDMKNDWHDFCYVPVYEDDWALHPKPEKWNDVGDDVHWSVVLIDHRPGERRVEDIRRLRNNCDIFVVHDTQQPSYCYEPVFNTFKYKYVYDRYATQTTLVSDTIDVSAFFEE